MRTVYAIVFSLITLTSFSQENQTAEWQNIELSLRTKNSLNATSDQLEQLKQAAIKKQLWHSNLLNNKRNEENVVATFSSFMVFKL